MKEQLLSLIELQKIDLRITQITEELQTEPEPIKNLKKELLAAKQELDTAQSELEAREKIKKDADFELQEYESKIKKSRQKMAEVKTNKEYQAILKEIDDLEMLKSQCEEKILVALEEIEKAKKVVEEKQKVVNELEERLKEAQQRLEQSLSHFKEELVELRQKRQEMAQGIDKELLKRYDFIRSRRNGRAVVAVDAEVCEGCHMRIPPQKYNELLKSDKLMTCPSCQRIIYWKGILENNGNKED